MCSSAMIARMFSSIMWKLVGNWGYQVSGLHTYSTSESMELCTYCVLRTSHIAHMLGIFCHSGFGFHPYICSQHCARSYRHVCFCRVAVRSYVIVVVVFLLFRNWFSTIVALLKFDSYKNRIVFVSLSFHSQQSRLFLSCVFEALSSPQIIWIILKVHRHKQINNQANGMNRNRFYLCVWCWVYGRKHCNHGCAVSKSKLTWFA